MGQTYRYDPETGLCNRQEPSPPQLAWLRRADAAHRWRLPIHSSVQTMRACHERGWVRAIPSKPDYMLGYYTAKWFLTESGQAEVSHYAARARLAREMGVKDSPRLSKLIDG